MKRIPALPERGKPFIICDNLVKIYKVADLEVVALQGLDLEVASGEIMAIIGNSGSGKSTLLNTLGGLDRPSAGTLTVGGLNLIKFSDADLVWYKRYMVGFGVATEFAQLDFVPYGAGERPDAFDYCRHVHKERARQEQRNCWRPWVWAIAYATAWGNYPAVNSNALLSLSLWHSRRRCCLRMSPPVRLIPKPPAPSTTHFAASTKNSVPQSSS